MTGDAAFRWLVALLLLAPAAGRAASAEKEKDVREAVWGQHFVAGVKAYDDLIKAGDAPSGQASYLAGFAYWKMHQAEKAEPLIDKAVKAGFRAGGGRVQPDELQGRISQFIAAKPAAASVDGLDGSIIDAYADEKNDDTRAILAALPRFAEIGRDIFGRPPPVRFFLFARASAMTRLYTALEIKNQRSTGMTNLVVVCAEKAHRPTEAETVSMALHESLHAWAWSYLQAHHDRPVKIPAYVDEGLAVYVASRWSKDLDPLALERLKRVRAQGKPAPELEKVQAFDDFHNTETSNVNYLVAGQLMRRLLGPPETGAKKIPAVLDAFASTSDDAQVWRQVTGKDVRAEFASLVAELWK